MREELRTISMGKYDNPKTLFSQITTIMTKYRGRCKPLDVDDKVEALSRAVPFRYKGMIRMAKEKADLTGEEIDLKYLRLQLFEQYRMEKLDSDTVPRKGRKEISLYAGEQGKGAPKNGKNSTS